MSGLWCGCAILTAIALGVIIDRLGRRQCPSITPEEVRSHRVHWLATQAAEHRRRDAQAKEQGREASARWHEEEEAVCIEEARYG